MKMGQKVMSMQMMTACCACCNMSFVIPNFVNQWFKIFERF